MRKKHLLTKALTLVLSAAICAGGTGLETPGCVCGNYTDAGSAAGWRAGTGRYCISK